MKTFISIAELDICFESNHQIISHINREYAHFKAASATIKIGIHEQAIVTPTFAESGYIPEIRYLDNGFEIDQAPYYFLRYDESTRTGTLKYSPIPHKVAAAKYDFKSSLAFGLRRGIGVLFVTLLAQDKAPGFHAAALNVNGRGIMAPGDSGTGKSTFFAMFPEPMQLNDEFVILRNTETGPQVFSTPFSESWAKDRQNRNVPLKLLLKLVQASEISSTELKHSEIIHLLLHNSILPFNAEREYHSNFQQLFAIAKDLKAEKLGFTLDAPSVAQHVYEMVQNLKS